MADTPDHHPESKKDACERSWRRFIYSPRKRHEDGKTLLDEWFALQRDSDQFRPRYVEALRTALSSFNLRIAFSLLDKYEGQDVFSEEHGFLHAAIVSRHFRGSRCERQPELLVDIVQRLIARGASVNALDSDMRHPLYYACLYGQEALFKLLVKLGADYTTVSEEKVESSSRPSRWDSDREDGSTAEVNLLDVALGAFVDQYQQWSEESIRALPMEATWGDIIMFLLEAGLTFELTDPSLVQFFHIACSLGNVSYVERLLDIGVKQTASPATPHPVGVVHGSGLHAAVYTGQKEIVGLLLARGAVADEARLCKGYSQERYMLKTPIAHAMHQAPRMFQCGQGVASVIDCCCILVEAGVSNDDFELLLRICATSGRVKLVKRLSWGSLLRTGRVPLSNSLAVIKAMLAAGIEIDPSAYQSHALENGNLETLKFLVERSGPSIPREKLFTISSKIMRVGFDNWVALLKYLLADYCLDINATFPIQRYHDRTARHGSPLRPNEETHSNLLYEACDAMNTEAIQVLLDHGADPECPGLPRSSIDRVLSKQRRPRGILHFAQTEMPVIQALLPVSNVNRQSSLKATLLQCTLHLADGYQRCHHSEETETPPEESSLFQVLPPVPDSRASCGSPVALKMPEVDQAMVPLSYDLWHDNNNIRLLELDPSQLPEEPLKCRLVLAQHNQTRQYEVLSCDWRSAKQTDRLPLSVNGRVLLVPSVICEALQRVRLSAEPRALWIDAICINQCLTGRQSLENMENELVQDEWNQQLKRLPEIHEGATRLLVWLGKSADESDLVFQHMDTCRTQHKHINWCHYGGATEAAFRKLCERSWFYTARSVQQLALTKKATVMCGDYECAWVDLTRCTSSRSTEDYYHSLGRPDGRTYLHHLREASKGKYSTLWHTFRCIRHCAEKDPRDKVFAMAGIPSIGHIDIPIDYHKEVTAVYLDFTRQVIEARQSLEILSWLGPQKEIKGLPSWVPDFGKSKPIGVLPRVFGYSSSYSVHYPLKTVTGLGFPSPEAISIPGRYMESITSVGHELEAGESFKPGTEWFQAVVGNWESVAANLRNKRFTQSISDAFADTLVGNDKDDITLASDAPPHTRKERPRFSEKADAFDLWYKKHGTGILRGADVEYFDKILSIKAWMMAGRDWPAEKELEAMRQADESLLRRYARQMETTSYGRRFFVTDKGSMGLAPPGARADDEIVFFPGGRYPFVLRPRNEGGGTYEMIGDCFLYDFDVFALFQDEGIETRQFVIT